MFNGINQMLLLVLWKKYTIGTTEGLIYTIRTTTMLFFVLFWQFSFDFIALEKIMAV